MPLDDATLPQPDQLVPERDCDVLVIGGGPAGATAAAILAEKGRCVVLLEKERHPRFHIGESLLPQNLRLFDRLGLRDAVARIGVHKPGARFVSDEHGKDTAFDFAGGLNRDYTYSYHVRRSDFDALLFRHALARGADAREGVRVEQVVLEGARGARVLARDAEGRALGFRARFVIDASGRDTFLAGQMRTKESNREHNTAALYAHFRGVGPAPGHAEDGNITIHLFAHGWFWMIPLPDEVMSVGVVAGPAFFKRRKGGIEGFFREALAMSPSVAARMTDAVAVSPATATGNYSYRSSAMTGAGWAMIGDAYAFVDPIFSSGVLLAMASAEMGAEAAHVWLDDPARAAPMFRAFERKVKRAIASLSWLIYRINDPVLRDMFMEPRNNFRMREGLVSLLAGDVHADTNRQLPVLAFKACYHMLRGAHRMGYRLRGQGLVKLPPGAEATAAAPS